MDTPRHAPGTPALPEPLIFAAEPLPDRQRREPISPGLGLAASLIAVTVLVLLGWAYLTLMVLDMAMLGEAGKLGPGMGLLERLVAPQGLDPTLRALIDALCSPSFGRRHFGMPAAGLWSGFDVLLAVLMWIAMGLAMMLPTALPMLAAAQMRADAKPSDGMAVMAGYLIVWGAFALVAAGLQAALTAAGLVDAHTMAAVSPLFGGAVLVGAGLYQLSPLKAACVLYCQRPEAVFAREAVEQPSALTLGLRQGIACLGCCWAMMLTAFALGLMNLVWMALIGAVMAVEKMTVTTRFSRVVGLVLILAGIAMIAVAVIGRLPMR